MSLPINIATLITYGKICSYLAANDFAEQKMLKGRFFNDDLPQRLNVATNLVEWAYGNNPDNSSLVSTGNYLYQLCGKYIAEAQFIISGNGTGSIVNPATGVVSTIQAVYMEFIVGSTPSPYPVNGSNVILPVNGASSFVITVPNILNGSIGIAKDTVPLPTSLNDRYSFTPIYTTNNVTITLSPAGTLFANGDLFVIMALQYVSI